MPANVPHVREELGTDKAECQVPWLENLVTDRHEATRMWAAGQGQLLCQLLNKPSALPSPLLLPPTHCAYKGCITAPDTSFHALKVQANWVTKSFFLASPLLKSSFHVLTFSSLSFSRPGYAKTQKGTKRGICSLPKVQWGLSLTRAVGILGIPGGNWGGKY